MAPIDQVASSVNAALDCGSFEQALSILDGFRTENLRERAWIQARRGSILLTHMNRPADAVEALKASCQLAPRARFARLGLFHTLKAVDVVEAHCALADALDVMSTYWYDGCLIVSAVLIGLTRASGRDDPPHYHIFGNISDQMAWPRIRGKFVQITFVNADFAWSPEPPTEWSDIDECDLLSDENSQKSAWRLKLESGHVLRIDSDRILFSVGRDT